MDGQEHKCLYERERGQQDALNSRIKDHMYEADRENGHRQRLDRVESDVSAIKSCGKFAVVCVAILSTLGGVIGGLLGKAAPALGNALAGLIISLCGG